MWDIRRLKTAEMKSIRRTARCSLLDHRRNENILEELKIDTIEKNLGQYKQILKCYKQDARYYVHKTTP
jgi:hypothetical protein